MANRSKQRLSDFYVERLKAGPSDKKIWDADIPGFGIRITPKGMKSWIVQFDRNGKKVIATLGSVKTMKEASAREKANELRGLHKDGIDILAHLKAKTTAPDLSAVVKRWEDHYANHVKPSTSDSYKSIIKTCILPRLGKRLVKDLNLDDVRDFHTALQSTPTQANRAVAVLSRLLTIAIVEGWRETVNPCLMFKRPTEAVKKRTFSIGEFARLEKALAALVLERKLDETFAELVRFIALSGLRSGEALDLTWGAVEEAHNVMRFDSHKTDAGGTKPKLLPLNTHLKKILKRVGKKKTGTHVFASAVTGGRYKGVGKSWNRIREKAKLVAVSGELPTLHDLRRTFRSHCGELGFPDSVGETLLGHSLGKVKDTYIKYTPDGILGEASQVTADWIAEALKGGKPKIGERIKRQVSAKSKNAEPMKKPLRDAGAGR